MSDLDIEEPDTLQTLIQTLGQYQWTNRSAKEKPLLPCPREADVLMLLHSVVTRNGMLLDYLGAWIYS